MAAEATGLTGPRVASYRLTSLALQLSPYFLYLRQHFFIRDESLPHEHPPQGFLFVEARGSRVSSFHLGSFWHMNC